MCKFLLTGLAAMLAVSSAQVLAPTPAAVGALLKEMKVEFAERAGGFMLTLGGRSVSLEVSGMSLHLAATLTGPARLEQVNAWNAEHRFSRAYLDNQSQPHLESDLPAAGGTTQQTVTEFVKAFGEALPAFAKTIEAGGAASSRVRFKIPHGEFAISVDMKEWSQTDTHGGPLGFQTTNGEGYAVILSESMVVQTAALKSAVIENFRKQAPDGRITLDTTGKVNGHEVLVLGMEGTVNGVDFRYLGYYYAGTSGVVQAFTYTSQDRFDRNLPAFTRFLEGLEIGDSDVRELSSPITERGPGRLDLLDGRASLEYDKGKWRPVKSGEVGRYLFIHSSSDAGALVITESLKVPLDSMADVALKNMQSQAPDARITRSEHRTVNGVELLYLEMEANIRQRLDLAYRNYYYSGDAGIVQIMTWAPRPRIGEFEKELQELRNGFRVGK
jgi:hypothetical protein